MKKAVVTGGCGFIGSHMVDLLLDEGYEVSVIDNLVGGRRENLSQHEENSKLSVYIEDIRSIQLGHEAFNDADYVFHFAGIGDIVPSIEQPMEYMSVNLMGTINVLDCARMAEVKKFVYAASSSCYGLAEVPTDENHPINTKYPYALSKFQGEEAVMHWQQVYKMPVNSIRIFNAYGTRSRTSGAYGAVFGVFLKQKIENAPLTIVGDGTQKRDFLYVSDVARAFYAAATTQKEGQIYNLGAGDPKSVNYLAKLLGNNTVFIPKRPGEPDCTWANISKITDELGWKQEVSFEQGVATILDNIDYWKEAPLWDKENIAEATTTWFKYMKEDS